MPQSASVHAGEWAVLDSNQRPLRCERCCPTDHEYTPQSEKFHHAKTHC